MADADYTFAQARTRLEDIVAQVRKKDVSLEKSLDLLEEGVRLANACTEHIDQSEWRSVVAEATENGEDQTSDSSEDDEHDEVAQTDGASDPADDTGTVA